MLSIIVWWMDGHTTTDGPGAQKGSQVRQKLALRLEGVMIVRPVIGTAVINTTRCSKKVRLMLFDSTN